VVAAWFIYRATTNRSSKIHLNGTAFSAEVVDTPITREKGLSDRDQLDQHTVMLFVFQRSENQCFWMRDMKFPIDIVWLDSNKKVSAIERNVSPATYPQNFCHDSQYVIELNAGVAEQINLKIGDHADL
jgi:uncharacterized membrane protein (UPF0127 family)